ncbi:COX15/CtaA family protein [Paenibacillus alkaliterrae]|uniref:COX15/CtaA family protein n=1 Tax=Paenibacillus alkaliterrae TaxID=320909 RepID=UPI001F3E21AF|nr:COX15/CtaA family protein [Paenibacillus alkaliterrae]MCF2937879.1 COX15/CtaA family protein [Paenibacillus alkaliterrae]
MVTGRFRALAIAACIGMLLVLLGGALVTNTDSGLGCGDDWPLCHGKFIPAYTIESMIEYSHRLVSGIIGLLVLAVFLTMIIKFRKDRSVFKEPLFYAGGALLFTVIQALMGAAAVKWPQSPPIMAIHFGISLIAFAATLLLVIWTFRAKHGPPAVYKVPRSIFPRVLAVSIYCYVVVYLGAFIRHTESGGGCLGWPLCNGEIVPEISGATGAVFIHRVAALVLAISLAGLYIHIRKVSHGGAGLTKSAAWTLGLVVTQVFSGALLTLTITDTDLFLFTNLLHNLIVTGLFGLLMDLLVRSWRLREGRGRK